MGAVMTGPGLSEGTLRQQEAAIKVQLAITNANAKGQEWSKYLTQIQVRFEKGGFSKDERAEVITTLQRIHQQIEKDPSILRSMDDQTLYAVNQSVNRLLTASGAMKGHRVITATASAEAVELGRLKEAAAKALSRLVKQMMSDIHVSAQQSSPKKH